jgi:hypothetical protein
LKKDNIKNALAKNKNPLKNTKITPNITKKIPLSLQKDSISENIVTFGVL